MESLLRGAHQLTVSRLTNEMLCNGSHMATQLRACRSAISTMFFFAYLPARQVSFISLLLKVANLQ